jgi:hypothetical protein
MQAVECLQALQCSELLAKVEASDESWYQRITRVSEEKSNVLSPIAEGDHFFWLEQKNMSRALWVRNLLCVLVLVGLYRLRESLGDSPWKITFRYQDAYYNVRYAISTVSMVDIVISLFVAPLFIVLVRAVLFMITHLCCPRGLWLFPNLISDSTFFGPFSPLYAWDTEPKESLGLRWRRFRNSMLAELGIQKPHRRNRAKRMTQRLRRV